MLACKAPLLIAGCVGCSYIIDSKLLSQIGCVKARLKHYCVDTLIGLHW